VIDEREIVRVAVERLTPPEPSYERLVQRRDRKRRNQRIAAGVVGIAVFTFAAIGFIRLLGSERESVIGPATSPSSTASPSPVTQPPSPFTERFDSPLHGLSIGYPSGWRTRAASEPWSHGAVAFGAPDVDVIFDPTLRNDLYLAMVSEPLDPGESDTEWVSDVWPNLQSVGICKGSDGERGGDDPFHGNYAWFEYCDEQHGAALGHVVIVATGTRGYIIYLHVADERRLQATYETHWFERVLLKAVDLRPEDALDALGPSEPP
jgi:hypothetical protein